MDLSVLMPVGSIDQYLNVQLEALEAQTFGGSWELILAANFEDASEIATLERLTGELRLNFKVVDACDIRSASHARNVAASEARGDQLLFCDGDDIAHKDWITELLSALDTTEAVGGHLDEELLSISGQEDWRPPATPNSLPEFMGYPYLVSANMAVRKDLFHRVGGFDTSLTRGEDIAFSWDLIDAGVTPRFASSAIVYYRHRKGLIPMMKQHYLYGIGFSEVLTRRGVPGEDSGTSVLRPNTMSLEGISVPYVARRGSIALGRIVGLGKEKLGVGKTN